MHSKIITASLIGSAIVFALTIDLFSNLLMFLLVGQVPGTHVVLSPAQMGIVLLVCVGALVIYFIEIRYKAITKIKYSDLKSRLPKRRYYHA
ncbi:hypothetical protein KBD87_01095 [Candidatus Saccharibacteria bacterium]|nr:hypothetical protein [Candidatus Saccharibacteria bacterium]